MKDNKTAVITVADLQPLLEAVGMRADAYVQSIGAAVGAYVDLARSIAEAQQGGASEQEVRAMLASRKMLPQRVSEVMKTAGLGVARLKQLTGVGRRGLLTRARLELPTKKRAKRAARPAKAVDDKKLDSFVGGLTGAVVMVARETLARAGVNNNWVSEVIVNGRTYDFIVMCRGK